MSDEKAQVPTLPHRENVTAAQFSTLLSAFIHAANFLIASRNDEDREGGPLDGGAVTAVECTVIAACDRLDAMMKDNARWDLGAHNAHAAAVQEIYTQQARMIKAQADAYEEICTPHHRLKPQMVKMTDGSWLAFAGNPEDLDNAMCGVGDCPAKALEAFDALFNGEVPAHLRDYLAARASAIESGQTPPDVVEFQSEQNKNKTNEKQSESLGGVGNSNPENAPRKRRFHKRYRDTTGPQPEVGGDGTLPK